MSQSTLESLDVVAGTDRLVVGLIQEPDADLWRLTLLIESWQRQIDQRLAKQHREKGTLS